MQTEPEYRTCINCEHIEDCPHPDVDIEGKPIPPDVCYKPDKINLEKRVPILNANI